MTMTTEHRRELKEIFTGGLQLLASPADILSLKERRRNDKRLDKLFRAFEDPSKREALCAYGWQIADAQIEHRIKMHSSPYIGIIGRRGMGKSETAMYIEERISDSFLINANLKTVPGFGRNASDLNAILAKATTAGKVVIVIGDESEDEVGTGKNTEEQALIDNLETIRMLRHTVIRCANRYSKLRVFSYYCDFILEVIFSDRTNKINYCILYIVDEEIGGSDPRIPVTIIDVPLHTNEVLRRIYEGIKKKEQEDFTSSGGRRSRIKRKLEPVVQALVQYCQDKGLRVGRGADISKADDLSTKLIFHITVEKHGVSGDKWNSTEQKLICTEAYDRLKELEKGVVDEEADDMFTDYIWESDFEWRDKIAAMIETHPDFKKYYLYFLAAEVEGLSHNKDAEKFTAITGTKKTANYSWIKRMRDNESFQGWLKDRRARLHESYLAGKFRAAGWEVEEKPQFEHDGLRYEEDLLIRKKKQEVWINAKCGSGSRTYVAEEYKTTYILANNGKETYVLYLDLERLKHEVHTPSAKFAVGTGRSSAEVVESPKPSTPFLLLRVADGDEEGQKK